MRTRRTVLSSVCAGLAALAGCNGGGDATTDTTSTTSATTTAATTSATPTDTTTTTTESDDVDDCPTAWDPSPMWTVDASSVGAPHVASDRVYATVGNELRAFAAEDGSVQWRQPFADDPGAVRAVTDGAVLISDDGVTAFDAASGDRLWSFVPPGGTSAKWNSVAVHDGTAYVVAAQVPTPSTDPDIVYGRLYVFDLASGDRLGVHDLTPDDRDWLQPVAVLADDTGVYVTIDAGGVLGASHDGTVRWRREGDDWYFDPVLAGDVLVQPQSRQVTALDPETGETVWTDDRLDTQVAAADGVVYGVSGGSPQTYATLTAVDAATGDARWTSKLDGCGGTIAASGGVVATGVSCRKPRIDLYDAADGCRHGAIDGSPDAQPGLAIGDDALYATRHSQTDELLALPLP